MGTTKKVSTLAGAHSDPLITLRKRSTVQVVSAVEINDRYMLQ